MRRRAILYVLAASAAFTVSAALAKAAAAEIPTIEIVMFRSVTVLLCLMLLLPRQGGLAALRTRRPWGHVVRTISGFAGTFGAYYGYAHLPLAMVTALGFAMPIFLTLLSVPLLGERVGLHRAGAVAAGLLGVLIVLRPWELGGEVPALPAMVVLAGVLAWTFSMISIRRMGQSGERNITIVLWFSVSMTVLSTALAIPVWVTPSPAVFGAMAVMGAVSAGAQLLMTEGYRSGEATMLAPFEYVAILYTVLLGWSIWGERPGLWEFTGIAILVASGLYTWWRESNRT